MNLIQLIACIGLITGCFVLLHISPMDLSLIHISEPTRPY